MKTSRRNLRRAVAERDRRAAGKPAVSKFARRHRGAEDDPPKPTNPGGGVADAPATPERN